MLPGRLADMPQSCFAKLATLLSGITPESYSVNTTPAVMTVGEPQDAPPPFIAEIIAKHARDFGRYPPIAGNPAFRAACAGWLSRRFQLPASAIDPDTQILPLNGSREGLFYALFALVPESKAGGKPVVLIPNPFYSTYPATVLAAGAEAYYAAARAETNFLPDFDSVPKDVLKRTIAAFYCSPSNPQSTCASESQWRRVFELADEYDFTVLADECYCEIYDGAPPVGSTSVRHAMRGDFERLLSLHSLSKRSNLPGLRSGFVAGPPALMKTLTEFRNTSAPQVPLPVIEASTFAWNDDAHVEANRAVYRERFAIAHRLLGNTPGFRLPEGASTSG